MRTIGLPEILTIFGMLFMFSLLLIVAFVVLRGRRRDSVQKTLIEKFGSARDLAAFLETPGGQRFADSLSNRFSNPLESVLGSIHRGIILFLLGFGCLLLTVWMRIPPLVIAAVLLLCLGVAFLLSAFVSYRLSKTWGMVEQKPVDR